MNDSLARTAAPVKSRAIQPLNLIWRSIRRGVRNFRMALTRAGRRQLRDEYGFQGALFHSWLFPLTRSGKLLLVAFIFSALPAGITMDVPIYWVAVAIVTCLLLTTLIGSMYRWGPVSVTGDFPPSVVIGEWMIGRFTVRHTGRIPIYELSIGCFAPPGDWEISPQTPMVELLRGGESVTLLVKLRPWKRGDFAMTPVRVFTLFPFGIGRNELGRCRNGLVRVLPRRLLLLDVRLPSQLAGEMHGTFEQYRTGQSMDYIGSRDYFPGDDIRRIDFRSWARLGKPLVREFSAPRSQRIALILDLERRQERICWKKLLWRGWCPDANEAAISLAISVADWLSSRGVELEIRMAGDLDQGWSIAPGLQSIDAFWEELARVKPNRVTALSAVCEPIALDLGRKLAAGIVISSRQQSPPLYLALQNLMQAVPIGRVIRVTNGRSAKNMEPVSGMWTETEIDSREILSQQLQTV